MRLMKATFWAAAVMTLVGAYIFAFPDTALGRHYKMPTAVPVLYSGLVGWVLVVFGCMYAWMACQSRIVRPLLYVGAFGKGGAFLLGLGLWLSDQMPIDIVMMLSGDAVLAAIWFGYLLRTGRTSLP